MLPCMSLCLFGANMDKLGSAVGVQDLFVHQHWAVGMAILVAGFN